MTTKPIYEELEQWVRNQRKSRCLQIEQASRGGSTGERGEIRYANTKKSLTR